MTHYKQYDNIEDVKANADLHETVRLPGFLDKKLLRKIGSGFFGSVFSFQYPTLKQGRVESTEIVVKFTKEIKSWRSSELFSYQNGLYIGISSKASVISLTKWNGYQTVLSTDGLISLLSSLIRTHRTGHVHGDIHEGNLLKHETDLDIDLPGSWVNLNNLNGMLIDHDLSKAVGSKKSGVISCLSNSSSLTFTYFDDLVGVMNLIITKMGFKVNPGVPCKTNCPTNVQNQVMSLIIGIYNNITEREDVDCYYKKIVNESWTTDWWGDSKQEREVHYSRYNLSGIMHHRGEYNQCDVDLINLLKQIDSLFTVIEIKTPCEFDIRPTLIELTQTIHRNFMCDDLVGWLIKVKQMSEMNPIDVLTDDGYFLEFIGRNINFCGTNCVMIREGCCSNESLMVTTSLIHEGERFARVVEPRMRYHIVWVDGVMELGS